MVSIFNGLMNNEYFVAILIIIISFILSKVINYILKKYAEIFAKKTKTDIDDIILKIIKGPLHFFIIFIGVYIAVRSLNILVPYEQWIKGFFFTGIVFIVTLAGVKIIDLLVIRWLKVKKKFERTPKLLSKVVNVIIYTIALLIILEYFNIKLTPIIATLGVGALAVGLALQNTLSNFFAGLHIISDRPINVGDFIELEGTQLSGYVEDIGWRSTRIRTLPNNIIVVPNSKLAESIIINDSMPQKEMSVVVQCGVSYRDDLEKVEKVTIDAAKKIQKNIKGAVKTFVPFIRYHTFGDSNINFSVILRVEEPVAKYLVVHEFIKELKKNYDKNKIDISWPIRKVYMAK
jgi:small-conductance mechanosensitive channel